MDDETRALATKALNDNLSAYYRLTPLPSVLGFYWPFGTEMDVRPFIHYLAQQDDKVTFCLPVTNGDKPMQFFEWTPDTTMTMGEFGIDEPAHQGELIVPDTVLVPLLMCDKHGNRLGYGKGHYDRAMASMPTKPFLIGIGFDEQVHQDKLPAEDHDIKLDLIITPRQVIEIK